MRRHCLLWWSRFSLQWFHQGRTLVIPFTECQARPLERNTQHVLGEHHVTPFSSTPCSMAPSSNLVRTLWNSSIARIFGETTYIRAIANWRGAVELRASSAISPLGRSSTASTFDLASEPTVKGEFSQAKNFAAGRAKRLAPTEPRMMNGAAAIAFFRQRTQTQRDDRYDAMRALSDCSTLTPGLRASTNEMKLDPHERPAQRFVQGSLSQLETMRASRCKAFRPDLDSWDVCPPPGRRVSESPFTRKRY